MPAHGLEPTLSLSYIVVGLIAMIASLQTCIRAWYDTSGTAEMEFRWRMKRGAFAHGALAVPLKEINFNAQNQRPTSNYKNAPVWHLPVSRFIKASPSNHVSILPRWLLRPSRCQCRAWSMYNHCTSSGPAVGRRSE